MSTGLRDNKAPGERLGSPAISQALRRDIQRGRLRAGQQLPAISELAQLYRTTPITVRRALRSLEDEGLLRVEHGVGTFVTDWPAQYDLLQLPSFSAEMAARSLTAATELAARSVEAQHAPAAAALDLPPGTPLLLLARRRLLDGSPVAFQRSYLGPELRSAAEGYAEGQSLYERIHALAGRVPASAEECLRPVVLEGEPAQRLEVTVGTVGWFAERTTFDTAGLPLVYDEAWFSGERVALRVRRRARQATLEYELTR